MIKRSLIAVAAVVGMGLSVSAKADPVVFNDQAGTFSFSNLVWQVGNALAMGAQSTAVDSQGRALIHTVAQARLSAFTLASGGSRSLSGNAEITYQADFWEYATGIGGATAGFFLAPPPAGFSNTLTMYYDNSAANFGDNKTGKGYGADPTAVKILQGNLKSLTGNFTDFTLLSAQAFPVDHLDCDAGCAGGTVMGLGDGDQGLNTMTHQGNGNNQIAVDVTYQNSSFFYSNVSNLTVDMTQTIGVGVPFTQGNPWTEIVGQTPSFTLVGGNRVNGALGCATGGQQQDGTNTNRCDILLQTTGSSAFFTSVPEPTSLALVGIAVFGLGVAARKRKAG